MKSDATFQTTHTQNKIKNIVYRKVRLYRFLSVLFALLCFHCDDSVPVYQCTQYTMNAIFLCAHSVVGSFVYFQFEIRFVRFFVHIFPSKRCERVFAQHQHNKCTKGAQCSAAHCTQCVNECVCTCLFVFMYAQTKLNLRMGIVEHAITLTRVQCIAEKRNSCSTSLNIVYGTASIEKLL